MRLPWPPVSATHNPLPRRRSSRSRRPPPPPREERRRLVEVQRRQVEVRRHLVEQEAGSWPFLSTPGSWAYGGIGSRGCAQARSAEHARPRPEGAAAGVADPSRGDDAFVASNGGLGFTPSAKICKDLQGSTGGGHVPRAALGEDTCRDRKARL